MARSDSTVGQFDMWSAFGSGGLWSDEPNPHRGILWPGVILLQVSLTFGQLLGQAGFWSYVPHPPLPPVPQERHLLAKSDITLGQLDI